MRSKTTQASVVDVIRNVPTDLKVRTVRRISTSARDQFTHARVGRRRVHSVLTMILQRNSNVVVAVATMPSSPMPRQ